MTKRIATILPVACLLTACIQEEPLNAEADILSCNLSSDQDILMVPADTAMPVTSTTENIDIPVRAGADLHARTPRFIITEGATISPASGSRQDFSGGKAVRYVVTSQDGKWNRKYHVSYVSFELTTQYAFEDYELNSTGKYQMISEVVDGRTMLNWWGTGNPGYCLANSLATPTEYPTAIVPGGRSGNCLQLVTRSAGVFGKMAGMPIAPGNLFLGTFDVASALRAPLQATHFGIPFRQTPKTVKGYYKFKSGEQMTDGEGNEISGKDNFNIYAMLYENTDENGNQVVLDGTNSNDSPHLVLYGKIEGQGEADEWTPFSFDMKAVNGKELDPEKLARFGYNFSIVFSSSLKGDIFTGAVGSTLMIDDVEVECR
ncbi:MAG: PCMD domain-containing protein [Paludibacteraceae bacterium]|nr:PCMD domain-containing protein [Paludibacteraceae bacterium]